MSTSSFFSSKIYFIRAQMHCVSESTNKHISCLIAMSKITITFFNEKCECVLIRENFFKMYLIVCVQ